MPRAPSASPTEPPDWSTDRTSCSANASTTASAMLPASRRYLVVFGMNDRPAPTAPSRSTRNPSLIAPSPVFGSQIVASGTSSAFVDAPPTEIQGRKTASTIAAPPAIASGLNGSWVGAARDAVGIGCGAEGGAGSASDSAEGGATGGIGAVGSAGGAAAEAPAATGDPCSEVSPVPSACPQLRQNR